MKLSIRAQRFFTPGIARGLRLRLLAATLSVAVVAVLASAWVSHRETKAAVIDSVQADLDRPDEIVNAFALKAKRGMDESSDPWESGVPELAAALSQRTDLRVVVRYADLQQNVIADSDQLRFGHADPVTSATWYTIADPGPGPEVFLADTQAAYTDYGTCLKDAGIEITVIDQGGLRIPQLIGFTGDGASAAAVAILDCKETRDTALAKAATPPPPAYRPVQVFVGPTPAESGTFLDDGLSVRFWVLVAGVATLTVVVSAVVARAILRPVGELTFAAHVMAEGHLDYRVDADRSDELGELARAFNGMANSLETADRQRKRMTTDIAHELRTPLSNIRGYLEAAQDGVAPLTPALVSSLLEDTLLLQGLVEDLQELSVAESGRLQLQRAPTDVDDLAASVAAAHHARALQRGVAIGVDARTGLVTDLDARRMRQVVTNLVENAIRHTDAGGEILVSAHRTDRGVRIAVRDTGAGIEPEHLPHIFDRFYRTDASRNRATGGSGLGLAITRELVHAHGGTIEVASVLGQGTTFVVDLPCDVSRPAVTNGAGTPASV